MALNPTMDWWRWFYRNGGVLSSDAKCRGMKMFQTESSDWSDKSSPRAKNIAKNIVVVYVILTLLCILGYLYDRNGIV